MTWKSFKKMVQVVVVVTMLCCLLITVILLSFLLITGKAFGSEQKKEAQDALGKVFPNTKAESIKFFNNGQVFYLSKQQTKQHPTVVHSLLHNMY